MFIFVFKLGDIMLGKGKESYGNFRYIWRKLVLFGV